MVVGVLNLRPPLEERASGLTVSAFAWEVLDLDASPSLLADLAFWMNTVITYIYFLKLL